MRETKYTKKLYKAIRKLNLDKEELKGLLLCLYINGCSSEDCAKLFGTTEEQVIKFLESEKLYGYQACSKCGQLRDRESGFEKYKTQIYLICKDCKNEYIKGYHENNKKEIRKQKKKYYNNNKEKRKEYNEKNITKIKKYYQDNKEEIRKSHRDYYKNNKDERLKHIQKYQNSIANIELVQKLDMFEEVLGNQIRCKYCGKWMTPTMIQVYKRLQGVEENDKGYIYCSEECKQECPTFHQIKYPKGFKPASSREVNPILRQLVLARDNYTCQKCGKSQEELTVGLHCHHIIPHVNSPLETNDPDNCITLCKDCHKEVHKIPGCGFAELKCT